MLSKRNLESDSNLGYVGFEILLSFPIEMWIQELEYMYVELSGDLFTNTEMRESTLSSR